MITNGRYRAARFTGGGRVETTTLQRPAPRPTEVSIRVIHCGVCASNVPPWQGRPWFNYPLAEGAPGHEAVGIVEEVGKDVETSFRGTRVAYIGQQGFAEYEVAPASALLALPSEVGQDFLGEPLACTMNIFHRANIQHGDVVAIVGAGFLGRLLVPLALQRGARVLIVSRREIAVPPGVEVIVGERREEIVTRVEAATEGRLCDVVIEATGYQEPLDLAGEITRIRGRLIIAGYHQEPRVINMQLWNWRGLDVINAHERDPAVYLAGMRDALDTVRAGQWSLDGLISHRFPLDQLGEALRLTAERPPGFTKAVIDL
jgi:NADPH2:quinone reductase